MNDIERETLDLDVLFVGAGPAGLAGAYHLGRLIRDHNAAGDGREPLEVSIGVLEKGQEVGSHILSGAVVDPRSLKELFPGSWQDAPLSAEVDKERMLWLTERFALPMPIPPPLENHGNHVASVGRLAKWMAERCEEVDVDVFTEFPATEVLLEDGRVAGVRTGDRGIGHDGQRKANFEPGIDIRTRCTVLSEGVRGTLTKQLDEALGLSEGVNPQVYSIGIKELWEIPAGRVEPGEVIHTMGWPLGLDTFGGGFLYAMTETLFIVGLVVGLDYKNPLLDPHAEFQRMKTHPALAKILEGGQMVNYGAKALPEGGWWALPRLSGDGFLLTGDSAGFLNSMRLKGVHLAMKSGMLAAETLYEGLVQDDLSEEALARYRQKIEDSWVREELWEVRNFHQAFDKGALVGMFQAGVGMLTDGRGYGIWNRLSTEPGHERMASLQSEVGAKLGQPEEAPNDGKLTFDRLANVYNSGTSHDEDQPVHLLVADTDVCVYQCTVEYGNPCQRFCPAAVYEMVDDAQEAKGERLQINASNCVHCKTCDIMDPYGIITWVPPEGGGGPNYGRM